MRSPQVSERIKEAPAQALRGVFAGIGQLLLITDKLRNKTTAHADVAQARAPEAAQASTVSTPAEAASPVADPPVTAEAAEASSAEASPVAAEAASAEPVAAEAVATEPVQAEAPVTPQPRDFDKTGNVRLLDDEAETAVAAPEVVSVAETVSMPESVSAGPSDAPAPLPNYGELSIASLRARLRNLDVTQVRELTEYERAHEARADVIAMFERRIAKLEAEA